VAARVTLPHTPGAPLAWWQRGVIYQIYPRSFADANGDGVGDLRGIIDRLAYLARLGVDAIWISPIYRSPMADFGYDVSDHTIVDPLFGTLADFDALVTEAHRLGLRVLLDYVPNHTSVEHPWFAEARASRNSPRRDWYLWCRPGPDGMGILDLAEALGDRPGSSGADYGQQSAILTSTLPSLNIR
jgi:alpha-glucosidase